MLVFLTAQTFAFAPVAAVGGRARASHNPRMNSLTDFLTLREKIKCHLRRLPFQLSQSKIVTCARALIRSASTRLGIQSDLLASWMLGRVVLSAPLCGSRPGTVTEAIRVKPAAGLGHVKMILARPRAPQMARRYPRMAVQSNFFRQASDRFAWRKAPRRNSGGLRWALRGGTGPPLLRRDRFHQLLDADDVQHARQIVGQHTQRHLGGDLRQRLA